MCKAARMPLFVILFACIAVFLSACGDSPTATRTPSSTPGVVDPNIISGTSTAASGGSGVTIINGTPGASTASTPAASTGASTYGGLPLTTSAQAGKAITAIKSLIRYAISKELTAPGTAEGTATVGSEPYLLSAAWCAKTDAILTQNLKSITTKLSINDQNVPLDNFTSSTQTIGGQSCRLYDIVAANIPTGTYTINLSYVLATDVNDGIANNPAGTYTYIAHVTRP